MVQIRSISAIAAGAMMLAACATPVAGDGQLAQLDRERDAILALLPGAYSGEAPAAMVPDGSFHTLTHKLAPIDAPQFGSHVLYYQISGDGADGPALQAKIFVFDDSPVRSQNRMRAYVIDPRVIPGNLEQRPQDWAALNPAALMSFPDECAFRWASSETGEGYVGEVRLGDCAYASRAFGQMIRPAMRYHITTTAFTWSESLIGEDGTAIVDTGAPRAAQRLP